MWATVEGCELLPCQIPHLLSAVGLEGVVKTSTPAQVYEWYIFFPINTFYGFTAPSDTVCKVMGKDGRGWKPCTTHNISSLASWQTASADENLWWFPNRAFGKYLPAVWGETLCTWCVLNACHSSLIMKVGRHFLLGFVWKQRTKCFLSLYAGFVKWG